MFAKFRDATNITNVDTFYDTHTQVVIVNLRFSFVYTEQNIEHQKNNDMLMKMIEPCEKENVTIKVSVTFKYQDDPYRTMFLSSNFLGCALRSVNLFGSAMST